MNPGGIQEMSRNEIGETATLSGCVKTTTNTPTGINVRACTVRDIARLAGVSTATVSRVVNGDGCVSRKTITKVLTAVSRSQYCPNVHAAELGRANAGIPRKPGIDRGASSGRGAKKLITSSVVSQQSSRRKTGRLRSLEDENSRLRSLIANLGLDLEISRTISKKC
jgi:predicted transcriptional regulator